MKKPSLVVTRARNRGATESLKNNNFRNQLLHDLKKLANKYNTQGTSITDDFNTSRDDVVSAQNIAHELGERIKFLLRNT